MTTWEETFPDRQQLLPRRPVLFQFAQTVGINIASGTPTGIITTITVTDNALKIAFTGTVSGSTVTWTPSAPIVTIGSGNLTIAFTGKNNGAVTGTEQLVITDVANATTLATKSTSLAPAATTTLTWTGAMPANAYVIQLNILP